jgi:crotonobetainyl-CoA:carnitine CoA-transferase CaiB-like acyl-CoA transferase
MNAGALDRVRVLDTSQGVAGAFCGKLLAGLGADVIKVEPPGVGDFARALPPFAGDRPDPETSALFLHLNTGKRGLTLDLGARAGRSLLHALARCWADVVVTSVPPAQAPALGLDWASLAPLKEDLVVTSVTYFGQDGPYRDYEGCELTALALGGYLSLTGDPEREPLRPYGYQAEYHAGLHAATGTMAAILRMEAGGGGDLVDASVVEASSFLVSAAPGWYYLLGKLATRAGNRLANMDPGHFYPSTMRPCRDGWVHAHGNIRYRELLGVLIPDPRLNEPEVLAEQTGHADEIDAIMDRWLAGYDRHEVVAMAQTLRLPFTEVLTPAEVLIDEHLLARGALRDVDHPRAGTGRYAHAPAQLTATPWRTTRAPLLGEHSDAILAGILGLSDAEIRRLHAEAVV